MEDTDIIELINKEINRLQGLPKHEDLRVNQVRNATIFELRGLVITIEGIIYKEK